jgi:HD superfamily phosphohydrolase
LEKPEKDLLVSAGLLHDVGHGPFSHTLETTLEQAIGMNHMDLTRKIITGEEDNIRKEDREAFPNVPRVHQVLEQHDVSPAEVAELISTPFHTHSTTLHRDKGQKFFNDKRYLTQLINSPIDIDQIDYLLRDAYYTGVSHGIIDVDRLVQTFSIHHNDLVVDRKGLSALEGMFVARALMFSSVYFHKTVRIAELMLARAVGKWKRLDPSSIQRMVDSELMSSLSDQGGFQKDIAMKIKYRKLYKKAYVGKKKDLTEEQSGSLDRFDDPRERERVEKDLCRRSGAPEGCIIVDYPPAEISRTEPRISRTDIRVLDNGKVRFFKHASDMGRMIEARDAADWLVMIAADRPYVEKVSKIGEELLF